MAEVIFLNFNYISAKHLITTECHCSTTIYIQVIFSLPVFKKAYIIMSSLVAYEDSESEDENLELKMDRTSPQTESHEENQEDTLWNSSEVELSHHSFKRQPDSSAQDCHESVSEEDKASLCCYSQPLNWARSCCSESTATNHPCRDSTAALSVGETEGRVTPLQRLPHNVQRSADRLKSLKRLCSASSGIRPYIPKRQRLDTIVAMEDSKFPGEQSQSSQTAEIQILSSVSERIRPYIEHKHSVTGIPRKLLMSLGGHQGPVNMLQWCPVPHLSHLLLSASMDKTFKVCLIQSIDNCLTTYNQVLFFSLS